MTNGNPSKKEQKNRAISLLWGFIILLLFGFIVYISAHQKQNQNVINNLKTVKSNIDETQKVLASTQSSDNDNQIKDTIVSLKPQIEKINQQISSISIEEEANRPEELNNIITANETLISRVETDDTDTPKVEEVTQLLSEAKNAVQQGLQLDELENELKNELNKFQSNLDKAEKNLLNTQSSDNNQIKVKDEILKLEPQIEEINQQISSIDQLRSELGGINTNLLKLINLVNSDSDDLNLEQVAQLLSQTEQDVQQVLKSDFNSSYFWQNPPLFWLEIVFWGFVGTTLYLLSEIYTHYKSNEDEQKFIEMTPWYVVTLLRGTFIVFIILLGLSTVQIGIGQPANLSQAPAKFYVFLAAILGYFNRMAKEQLKLIVKAVFPDAWNIANPDDLTPKGIDPNKLKIIPPKSQLKFGNSVPFIVEPKKVVSWSKNPDIGSLSTNKGETTTYTAPSFEDANGVTEVIIKAIPVSGEQTQEATAVIILGGEDTSNGSQNKPTELKIVLPESLKSLPFGSTVDLTVEPKKVVSWSKNPDIGSLSTNEGETTTYTAPSFEDANGVTEIIIKAISMSGEQTQEATAVITLLS